MSKIIKMTDQYIEEMVNDFRKALEKSKMFDGRISYSKTFDKTSEEAFLVFSEKAWVKMQSLIQEFDKEVAWHGVTYRSDDDTVNEYVVEDIVVYPQEVTGATVHPDPEEYANWLAELEDEVYDNLKLQGHSHVNMGVTPSGTDNEQYESTLQGLPENDFQIFVIWNKKGDYTVKIYDLKKNTLFESGDVTVEILNEGIGLEDFMEKARGLVKTKPTTTAVKKDDKKTTATATSTTTAPAPTKTATPAKAVKKVEKPKKANSNYWDDYDEESWWYGRHSYGYGGY